MDLAHLSKHWTKHVEQELTQLFAVMGDSWVPHPMVDEQDDTMLNTNITTGGLKRGMDASGAAANDQAPLHH